MSSLFSTPKLPAVTPPTRMPIADDQASKEAKSRKANELAMNQGRASTNLTGAGGSGTKLGS